jgi:hypothetical protein
MKNKIVSFSVIKAVGFAALMAMLFPWVSFGVFDLDTQPWYIILGLVFILLCATKKVPDIIWLSYFLPAAVLVVGIGYADSIDFLAVRAVLSYFGLVVSIHSYYLYRKYYADTVLPILISANIAWLLSGFIQAVFGKYALAFIVTVRTTEDRGVTSLAPEPTYYAVYLIFLSWLIWIESGYKLSRTTQILLFANLLAIFVFAKSAMGFLFVIYFVGVYCMFYIFRRKVLYMVFILVPMIAALTLGYFSQYPALRISRLSSEAIEFPLSIIERDASINSRVAHFILPLHGALFDAFLPHGFHSYPDQAAGYASDYNGFFWYGYGGSKIMSTIGAVIYELGWFSIIFFSMIVRLSWNRSDPKKSVFNIFILMSFLIAAIPIAFPLIGMILAGIFLRSRRVAAVRVYGCDVRAGPIRPPLKM